MGLRANRYWILVPGYWKVNDFSCASTQPRSAFPAGTGRGRESSLIKLLVAEFKNFWLPIFLVFVMLSLT